MPDSRTKAKTATVIGRMWHRQLLTARAWIDRQLGERPYITRKGLDHLSEQADRDLERIRRAMNAAQRHLVERVPPEDRAGQLAYRVTEAGRREGRNVRKG